MKNTIKLVTLLALIIVCGATTACNNVFANAIGLGEPEKQYVFNVTDPGTGKTSVTYIPQSKLDEWNAALRDQKMPTLTPKTD